MLADNLYYDYNDLTHSDLVYMKKTDASSNNTIYQTGFATDNRKNTLKSAWNFSDATVREIIAVAYVYLEKQANTANNTENGIYEVTYTQELFNMLIEKCATFNEFGGGFCTIMILREKKKAKEIYTGNFKFDEALFSDENGSLAFSESIADLFEKTIIVKEEESNE